MSIIDLNLSEHSKEPKPNIFISEAIDKHNLIVILGSPGSGKTSILKKYDEDNNKVQFLKIKKFIKFDNQVEEDIKVLLLDGLDEYRSLSNDKTFVIDELANQLKSLENIKIVISCRELDWYGENDKRALKDELDNEAVVFSVQPLDDEQQIEMTKIFSIDHPDEFITKFSSYGFLDNPQMFSMLATLYLESSSIVLSSKSELYKAFIEGAKEQNPERTRNIPNQLSGDEILKYSGYLAFFYMFSNVDSFEEGFIDTIFNNEKGYTKEKLMQTLNTALFDNKNFIHRTIAEYALAYYLVNEKMCIDNSLDNERIKALFIKNEKVPTELRGIYAWICSLSQDSSFIKIDPFYQATYGDNSLFSEAQKKEIVLSVKKYAEEHPYFIDFWGTHNHIGGLYPLYTSGLDDFYIKEFNEASVLTNHYKFFIISILKTSVKLSDKMKSHLKKKLFDIAIPTYLKDDILEVFSDDTKFLLKVLHGIKEENIEDNDNALKEFLLKELYLKTISSSEIVEYLKLYSNAEHTTVGHGLYLFNTPYKDKLKLAISILKIRKERVKNKKENTFYGTDFMGEYIADFLYDTILKYPTIFDASNIYEILSQIKKEVEEYTHLEFEPYSLVREDDKEDNEHKFIALSDELYSLHIDEAIHTSLDDIKNIKDAIFDYNYLFPYQPSSIFNILINKIKSVDSVEIKKELFSWALTYIPFGYDDNFNDYMDEVSQLKKIAYEHGFEKLLDFRLSKEFPEWKEKRKERDEKKEVERLEILEKNEAYFSKRTDIDMLSSFGDVKYISDLIYIGNEVKDETKYLTRKTFDKLKTILKVLIYSDSIDKALTTLESLSKLTSRQRYLEQVYYTSLALNNFEENTLFGKIDKEILEYLYILDLQNSHVGNIIPSNFSECFEKENSDKAIEILKKYIELYIAEHYDNLNFIYKQYIDNDSDLEKLKRIALSHKWNDITIQDDLLNNILVGYAFTLSLKEFIMIESSLNKDSSNKIVLTALIYLHDNKKDEFSREMSVSLYGLFERKRFLDNISSKWKIKIIDYMFTVFETEKSIEFVGGAQSTQSLNASFLRDAVKILTLEELKTLYPLHKNENNIWRNRILDQIDTLEQQDADQNFERYPIEKVKMFALSNTILSLQDFFEDIYIKLEVIKTKVEDNRTNEKKLFYNDDGSSKNEEHCRDVILQKLNDRYGYDIDSTKEKYEADNRVDINIRYKSNLEYEIQVECKKDANRDLYIGIKNQLINKYLSSKVEFGIYLIFYFGDIKDKQKMLTKVDESISTEYKNKIKVVCIDVNK